MATRKIAIRCAALFYLLVWLGCSCTNVHHKCSDSDMIRMAEEYREHFQKQEISRIELRSNYYICFYNGSADYIVTCDCMLIRDINKNLEIISTNAKNDTCLSSRLQDLLAIVEDVYANKIKCISVKSDTISLERFDGYYITNVKLSPYSTLKEIQEGWYVNEE